MLTEEQLKALRAEEAAKLQVQSEPNVNVRTQFNPQKILDAREAVSDVTWLKNTFMLGGVENDRYNKWLRTNRFFSSADIKSSDTHIANCITMNPTYQFTRYADIRRPGMLRQREGEKQTRKTGVPGYSLKQATSNVGLGFGTYYSRAIDDNQQRIYLRFGEPKYTSMLIWALRSFDIHKAILYKRGRFSRLFISVVHSATSLFSILSAPLLFGARILMDLFVNPGKFVSIRDNMSTYWMMADTLLNKFYVKRTKVPFKYDKFDKNLDTSIDRQQMLSKRMVDGLAELAPGIVDKENGRISIWAIGLSGQAAFNRMLQDMREWPDDDYGITNEMKDYRISDTYHNESYYNSEIGDPSQFTKHFLELAYDKLSPEANGGDFSGYRGPGSSWVDGIEKLIEKYIPKGKDSHAFAESVTLDEEDDLLYGVAMDEWSTDENGEPLLLPAASKEFRNSTEYVYRANLEKKRNMYLKFGEYLESSLTNGAAFLILDVNSTGSVGESFSNTAGTNPIETAFNSISSKARSLTNIAGGFLDIPGLGQAISLVTDTALAVLDGASQGFSRPIAAIAMGTTVSLGKIWDSSSASLPSGNYKVPLVCPYGNPYSQLFSIYLPLACILAGSLPRATGSDTHTAPFMCQLFDPGRVNIPFGMIERLNILRGASNLPFTRANQPNSIEIEMSVIDLNPMLSLDLNASGLAVRAMHAFNPDFSNKAIDNYVETVTGLDVYSMFYTAPSKRLLFLERSLNVKALFTDQAALAGWTVGNIPFVSRIRDLNSGVNHAINERLR